ncbi:VOC family protein [Patulibacter minatonensis]|uniref:VOC family protein n=1 Tax=Patulibacter minatonensis TaxID=298163 RepID=UPI000479D7D6|nr:VOC family protein [Patulibacter minatonensis]
MPVLPPASDAPPRFRRVTLATTAMAEEQQWWTGRLGLDTAPGAPAGGFAVRVGSGVLAFTPVPDGARARGGAGGRPSHHVALEVAEDRLVEASEWLQRASPLVQLRDGETIVDFPDWAAHSVYAISPGGHVVELIARHRRPWEPWIAGIATPEEVRGAGLVRGISEVGITTPDVGALVDRLEGLGERLWYGDPRDGFAAVGDESGLLICVREWRPWFPTDKAAQPGPLSIELTRVLGLVPGEPVPVGSATELWAADGTD